MSLFGSNTTPAVQDFQSLNKELYHSKKYSDLVITCQKEKHNVHRVIVCTQSKPLAAAIDNAFKEASKGTIVLEDDEMESVDYMIEFLYTGNYGIFTRPLLMASPRVDMFSKTNTSAAPFSFASTPPASTSGGLFGGIPPAAATGGLFGSKPPKSTPSYLFPAVTPASRVSPSPGSHGTESVEPHETSMISHAKVYIIAEKYDIQPLKKLSLDKYVSSARFGWKSVRFPESLETIFEGTPDTSIVDGLRRAAIKIASEHIKYLLAQKSFVKLCEERGDIATAILKATNMSFY